jgi:3-deoxy-manno-octulosonate cytidylyltransferase (CMP-KDO synthetase)
MSRAKRIAGIIPARMASSRLPGKPIARIAGLTMIEHVFRRARLNPRFSEVVIATCDQAIADAAATFGCRAIMTSDKHERGTERVAEAAASVDADVVVNIQGDEPLLRPEIFDPLLDPFAAGEDVEITNLMVRLATPADHDNRNNVKVVIDQAGDALYFSREAIPTRHMGLVPDRVFRQIGIYAFTKEILRRFLELPTTPLEQIESCDMLRYLEHGVRIRMVETPASLQSVDTPADLAEAERLMAMDDLMGQYSR